MCVAELEFYIGIRPAKAVWFSAGNHPFSAETIIGLAILLQGQSRKVPDNIQTTLLDKELLIAARRSALLTDLLGLSFITFLALYVEPVLSPILFYLC